MWSRSRAVLGDAWNGEIAGGADPRHRGEARSPSRRSRRRRRDRRARRSGWGSRRNRRPATTPREGEEDRYPDARRQGAWSHPLSMARAVWHPAGRLTSCRSDTNMCSYDSRERPTRDRLRADPAVRPPGDPRASAKPALEAAGAGPRAGWAPGGRGAIGTRRGVRRPRRDAPWRGARALSRADTGAARPGARRVGLGGGAATPGGSRGLGRAGAAGRGVLSGRGPGGAVGREPGEGAAAGAGGDRAGSSPRSGIEPVCAYGAALRARPRRRR